MNQSYTTDGPGSTSCAAGPVVGSHSHWHLLGPSRTGLNQFSTRLTVHKIEYKKYISNIYNNITIYIPKSGAHPNEKGWKWSVYIVQCKHGPFVPICMAMCFRLCVFNVFTSFVYMFSFICTAVPRISTSRPLPDPPWPQLGMGPKQCTKQGPNDRWMSFGPR